jgi:hypothetical protein
MYLGHDAELAVLNQNGEGVSAHAFYPPKESPQYTGYYSEQQQWHRDSFFRDGTSLELNTPGGISCFAGLMSVTILTMQQAEKRLPEGYKLEPVSSYEVVDDLSRAPEDVVRTGCGPVRNAYEGWEEKGAWVDPLAKKRFAGGHIHVSAMRGDPLTTMLADEERRKRTCSFVVRYLDLFCAVPWVYLGVEGVKGIERRTVFGKAGEYRFQRYKVPAGHEPGIGIEYRVLGPEWLKDIGLAALAFNLVRGVTRVATNRLVERERKKAKLVRWSSMVLEAREAINKGDTKEIFESPTYQRRLERVLRQVHSYDPSRFQIRHLTFIRNNAERLFARVPGISKWVGSTSNNWPECLERWGFV